MHNLIFVDDNSDTLDLLDELFSVNHRVYTAANIESALRVIRNNEIDFAFIDVILGDDENGYDAAKAIIHQFPNISIRLMTSYTKALTREEFGQDFEIMSKMKLVLMMETNISPILTAAFSTERIA